MNDERWQKIERLYHSALELEEIQRAAFLQQACAGDKSIEREVISLLAESEGTGDFLEAPALEVAARELAASTVPAGHSHPAAIGRYRIIRLLGEGGMGTVYEAEQEEPRRVVALKVIKLGLATPDRLRRFRQESQALARLQHPGIAQIYEFNTADTGFGPQPYFAMEFIRGLPLRQYADAHRLDTRQKLALMVKVCEAVHHAHQRGLIHRDLKPGNILVDETGQPKVLDFGVARVIEADSPEGAAHLTMQTGLGQLVGTLAYMSPEQALGDPLEVDIRSDVYSLGVILYVLLSGQLPYEVSHRQLPEAARVICEQEPASLSSMSRNYRGDIETLVRKALEKDKTRRYASAAELASDIQHYLNNEPIMARPPSAGYQLKKFARRHRAGVAVGGLALVALFGATVSVAWEARIARQERDRAQQRFNDVRGLARQVIFDLQTKLAELPGTTEVRKDLVAIAINYLDTLAKDGYADQGLQGELAAAYIRIGDIQGNPNKQNLGDLPAALESYAKAERLARALVARRPSGQAKRLLGDALIAQADGARFASHDAKGATKAMEALQVARERVRSDPANADAQRQLGAALQCAALFGAPQDGLPYLQEDASVFEGMLAQNPGDLDRRRNAALAHKYIAGRCLSLRHPDDAFAHLKRAEELDAACVRAEPNNPEHKMDLAIDLSQWGDYYQEKNDIAKAIEYIRGALAIRRELAAVDPKNMRTQDRLAYIVLRLGDMQLRVSARQALATYQEARSIAQRLQPEFVRAEQLAPAIWGIGDAYQKLGDAGRSCSAYIEAAKLYHVLAQTPLYAAEAAEADKVAARCRDASH
ncbi:MAG TPA: serine/threonine-protein kinase [Bryobacteraceae bacterium]|nr:serine/threonine-protein kinase [Bryobacteraceae bacterium]